MAGLADGYDALIVDLWGVMHDGLATYPGAIDCLTRLRAGGKGVVFLSNAPRRAEMAVRVLTKLGVAAALYDGVMTSGEAVREALTARGDPWYAALGKAWLHIGPARDAGVLKGLDLVQVADVGAADFVINTGVDGEDDTLDDYRSLLDACLRRRLPMICANPDLFVVRQNGKRLLCAGTLAAYYADQGGSVANEGKPYARVYDACLRLLGGPSRARVLAVGDSLGTDIKGARDAGIAAAFISGGIHADQLADGADAVTAACAAAEVAPVAAMRAFVW